MKAKVPPRPNVHLTAEAFDAYQSLIAAVRKIAGHNVGDPPFERIRSALNAVDQAENRRNSDA